MDRRKNRDVTTGAPIAAIQQKKQEPPPSCSSFVRRSSRPNKFSGTYYYSADNRTRDSPKENPPKLKKNKGTRDSQMAPRKNPPKLKTNKRTRDSQMDQQLENPPKLKLHPPPPLDPEMMRVWFPPRETLAHVDVKKIRHFSSPNTGFSAKALAIHAAKHAPMVPASIVQKIRQQDALLFPTWYKYEETDNEEMKDKKTRICSAGGCHSWTEQSSGIPWVAVHGVHQICVIIIETYEVVGRSSLPPMGIGRRVLSGFLEKVVAEMEGTLSSSIESRQLIDQRFKKGPFAVVSVVRNPVYRRSSSEAPLATSDAEQCINFLSDKLKDASDFSYNDTVKTAISAMQYLFYNKLTPNDVLVSVTEKSDGQAREMSYRDVKGLWPTSAS